MKILISTAVLSIAALSFSASAQCELYYKFDRGVGTKVVNYGTAAVDSVMVKGTTGAGPWSTAGKYGGALAGSANNSSAHFNYVDTGFGAASSTGSFTVSWWCEQSNSPGTGLSYITSGRGSFRCFTNGVAGSELWFRAWGGAPADLKLPTVGNSFKLRAAAKGGVNVALVVDGGTAMSAQWYIDGASHGAAITLTTKANIPAGANFLIGKHSSNTSSFAYNIDEYRFCSRAATAAEIKAWHSVPHSGSGAFGKDCGIKFATTGSTIAGSANFKLNFKAASPFSFLLVIGLKPQAGFDMGQRLPGLGGCMWYTDFLVEIAGAVPSGSLSIPAPLPRGAAGTSAELQILGLDRNNKFLMSNAISVKIEKN